MGKLGVDQVSINFPNIWELLQNSRHQKGAVSKFHTEGPKFWSDM